MATPFQSVYDRLPRLLQEWVVAAVGWKRFRNNFGAPFQRILDELRRRDTCSADEVREDQERRLRETVRWAARTVPYYRDLFRTEGIDPESIRHVEDLLRIPCLEKETVRSDPGRLRSDAVPDRRTFPAHSSGTTGTALRLRHTREALGWEYGVIWRQREWFGMRLGDHFATFGGQNAVPLNQTAPPFWRTDRAGSRTLFSLYHMTPDNLASYVEELSRPRYRFWQGYPSSIALICQYILENDVDLGDARPRAVFTSSETLLEAQRDRIEKATGAPVADRYGHAEFSVSALQCPEGRYHVDTEFCALQIDPHQKGDGWVRGEVIVTGFANRAMPFVRYRTGDIATLLEDACCPCGRARPIVERTDGRIEDYVVTPDGRRIGRMDHVFKNTFEIVESQLFQPSLSRIVVRLVPARGYDESAERYVERELRRRLGDEVAIEFELCDRIPREPSGKFRAVVSDVEGARLGPVAEPDGDA